MTPRSAPRSPRWKRWLRRLAFLVTALALALAAFLGAALYQHHRIVDAPRGGMHPGFAPGELGRWVDPFIGTGGFPWMCGNNFPGAMTPFGMVRLGPETRSWFGHHRALNTSGYFYADDELLGFSHTRLNGTGATDGGHFLVLPALKPLDPAQLTQPRGLRFSHRDEAASPGYYAVRLPGPGVLAELTATPRVGVHRYTFPANVTPHLVLNVANAMGGRPSREGVVRILPSASEVEGSIRTFGSFASRYGGLRVHFVARASQPFARTATWREKDLSSERLEATGDHVGAELAFAPTRAPTAISLKLAISHVSVANARANLDAEAGAAEFEDLCAAAARSWEERLGSIRIDGGTPSQRTIFYTALFRCFQMPTLFTDANGDYLGFDRQTHRATGFQYYSDLSLWDTFRTTHPLYTLIASREQRDMLVSLVTMRNQGGWLPRWPSGHGYSNSMLGTPADIVLAEAYLKGIRDFDVDTAYAAMKTTALAPTPPGAAFSGRRGVEHYLRYQYCPRDLVPESVARTFEYGWADDAIARLAAARGLTNDAAQFTAQSRAYRNLWNPATQYFQPRDSAGRFFEPFKPLLLTYLDRTGEYTRDYVEGSALQWRWGAPYDAAGMIALFRSPDFFVAELDAFFARARSTLGGWNPGPYYWHGNQPDVHAAYLFNVAGRPDLTQKWVRWILDHKYGEGYAGLDGNDDGGTLSAWYVLSALGFYPVAGSARYQLGAPLFPRAEVRLAGGTLVISTENHAPDHPYVSAARLNGVELKEPWFDHDQIARGGELHFVMSPTPVRR